MGIALASIFAQLPSIAHLIPLFDKYDQSTILKALDDVPAEYRCAVLRKLIYHVENWGSALDGEVVEAYAKYMVQPPPPQPSTIVRYDLGENLEPITLVENRAVLLRGTDTSCRTWEAGKALAEYLMENGSWSGSRIVELGAGCGLVSLVLARLGANVVATDGITLAVERLQETVIRNKVTNCGCQIMQWSEPMSQIIPGLNLVVAADVLYDPDQYVDFISCINTLHPTNGVLVATTVRNENSYRQFKCMAAEKGWLTEALVTIDPSEAPRDHFWLVDGPVIEIAQLKHQS